MPPIDVRFDDLRRRHHAILFDAYGVLVDASGALPGAADTIAALRRDGQPFLVVTNDASRSAERAARRLTGLGLDVTPAHILSSGMLVAPALRELALRDLGMRAPRVVVLGTDDSAQYARDGGATVIAPSVDDPADAVVVADEGDVDMVDTLDETLSMIIAATHAGRPPRLFLANPDLIYPLAAGRFGITAGSFALVLERALALVLGDRAPTFEPLGKPSPRIFEEAIARVGTRDAVMIGDQLHTDIAGAASVGLASALVLGGVSHHRTADYGEWTPTYLLPSL